jgi:hypothetical protein
MLAAFLRAYMGRSIGMNLQEFTSGTPASKAWLNIVAGSATVGTLQADVVNANSFNGPITTAFASLVSFQTLPGVQTAANLFVGLSPNSRLTIPANSLFVGDTYRLSFNALIDAPVLGNSATFDLSTDMAGPIATFPVQAAVTPLPMVPVIARVDIVVASANTINTNVTIGGFVFTPGGPILNGFSFATAGVAFDTSVAQTFAFTYSTPDFASCTMTEIILARVATGSQ